MLLWAAEHLVQEAEDMRRLEVEHVILAQALRRVEAGEEDRRLRQARLARRGCKLIRLPNSLQEYRGRSCACLKKCCSEVYDLFSNISVLGNGNGNGACLGSKKNDLFSKEQN